MPRAKRYIMFDTDQVDLSIPYDKIKKFDAMWNDGCSIAEIAYVLQRKQVEVQLLAIDRFMCNAIKPRKGSMQGTKPWLNPSNNKIRMEA